MKNQISSLPRLSPASPARWWRNCLCFGLASLVAAPLGAATRDFADLSIEELMNESVTSVFKKETTIFRSPAAVAVVTAEDIRRLGVTSLPEALRWVPGMQVGRINAHSWAVSARGFQGSYSDKLLVMIDGRTLYATTFPGVDWDAQDVDLADLERIEVIRGPGATLWGANAVNGVVNIITKSARETQGTLVSVAAGTEERPTVLVRHGGQLAPNLYYRVFAKYFNRDGMRDLAGNDAPYDWDAFRTGFRVDWHPSAADALMFEGDVSSGKTGENIDLPQLTPPFTTRQNRQNRNTSASVLGRWVRTFSGESQLSVQAYVTRAERVQTGSPVKDEAFDFELQYRFTPAPAHDVMWGVGYRVHRDQLSSTPTAAFSSDSITPHLYTAFLQDEITVTPERLHFILGSKFEHNDYTGFETQPGARLLWTPADNLTGWLSLSRAVRTPDRFERTGTALISTFQPGPTSPPVAIVLTANPEVQSEKLTAYELGFRFEPSRTVSVDVATFYNVYSELIDSPAGPSRFVLTPSPPHVVVPLNFTNTGGGNSHGVEVAAQWLVTDRWQLGADYTWLRIRFLDGAREFDSPEHQVRLRSYLTLPGNWEINSALHYTSHLRTQPIGAYLRFDLGFVWHPRSSLEIGVWGQNLLDPQHPEANSFTNAFRGQVPRSLLIRVTGRF
jgi:iron complex outermembrane recepter protein